MFFINLYTRLKYFLVFFFHKKPSTAFKYLWHHLINSVEFIRTSRPIKKYLTRYPRMIEVETTTYCNLRCTMCEHTYWDEPPQHMSFEKFKHIIDQFPHLRWIGLTGIGSSFLNKDFPDILRYVKGKDIIIEMYDTFLNLDEEKLQLMVEIEVDRFIASIDGATKETYEKIRVASDFEKVIQNVRTLIALKKKHKKPFPQLSFQYIVMQENWHEASAFVDLVFELTKGDTAGIRFTPLLDSFNQVKHLTISEIPPEVEREILEKARKYKLKIDIAKAFHKVDIRHCTEWAQPFIFVDGSVIPCCASNEHNRRDFQVKTGMGNIFEEDFPAIWQGERFQLLRDSIAQGKAIDCCTRCPVYTASS